MLTSLLVLLLWTGISKRATPPALERLTHGSARSGAHEMAEAAAIPSARSGIQTGDAATEEAPGLDAFLDVHVRDVTSRNAVPGVRLVVLLSNATPEALARMRPQDNAALGRELHTDAQGRCTLSVPSGFELAVIAQHEEAQGGAASLDLEPLAPGERREASIELRITPDVHYFVRALAREDRRPIAGASGSLVLRPKIRYGPGELAKRPESVTEHAATGDDEGLIEIQTSSWRLMDLRIHARGFVPAIVFPAGHESPDDAQEVLLDRGASIEATVVDAGGASVAQVQIELKADFKSMLQPEGAAVPRGLGLPRARWSGVTGTDGRVVFEDLPARTNLGPTLTREGSSARARPDAIVLDVGERRAVEWQFAADCTLSGRVLDGDGKPVAGVQLWLMAVRDVGSAQARRRQNYFTWGAGQSAQAQTHSDDAGRYRFDSVAAGRWRLGPAAQRGSWTTPSESAFAPLVEEIVIPEGARSFEHDLVVQPSLFVRGRVVDPQGKPVRTRVQLESQDGAPCWTDESGADGTFTAGPISMGEFFVYAFAQNGFAHSEQVGVRAGGESVVLTLRPAASLTATLVDDETGEICPGQLHFSLRGGDGADRYVNSSTSPTTFQFQGLLPGTYDVTGRASEGRIGIVRNLDIAAGAHADVVVRVSRGAKLRVRCEGASSWGPLIVRSGEAEILRSALERGAVRVEDVIPGHVVIEFTPIRTELTERREVVIGEGEEKEIVFRDDS